MTQAKIDLKKLRERVADKDNPPHSDALKQSAWELLICCDPTGLRSLLEALDETRAALAKTECECREDFPGYADYECRRCRVLAKLEEKFE